MRDIAKMAQITNGSLYHYFPNKSELVKATFDEVAAASVPLIADAASKHATIRDRITAVLKASGRVMRDYPYVAAFDRALHVDGPPGLDLAENSDPMFTGLRSILQSITGQAERVGQLSPEVDAESAAIALFTVFRGLAEIAATTESPQYHATLVALRHLVFGTLFRIEAPTE